MHAEWEADHDLITPQGTLLFNQEVVGLNTSTGSGYFLLVPEKCGISTVPRVTIDDVPQGDGSIQHRRFESGIRAELAIQLWLDLHNPACYGDLRCMLDYLSLHLRSLLNADGMYRLRWSPTGYGDRRMLDQIRLREWGPPEVQANNATEVTIGIDSPFPYAIDMTQQLVQIPDGNTGTITMVGTTDFFPVIKMYGTFSSNPALVISDTTGMLISYDDDLPGSPTPGGADYIELDFFRNTAFINGDGADARPGIEYLVSDFFPLVVGPNEITASGCDIDVLVNNAWWNG